MTRARQLIEQYVAQQPLDEASKVIYKKKFKTADGTVAIEMIRHSSTEGFFPRSSFKGGQVGSPSLEIRTMPSADRGYGSDYIVTGFKDTAHQLDTEKWFKREFDQFKYWHMDAWRTALANMINDNGSAYTEIYPR